MEPNAGYSYDPYSKAPIYSEPCIGSVDVSDLYRNCSSNLYSVYSIWKNVGICDIAGELFCLSDSVHPALYGTGDKSKKGLCAALRRIALKGDLKNELDKYYLD